MSRIQSLRGMRDILPAEAAYARRVEDLAREIVASYGYEEIRLPLLESTALYERSAGEASDIVEKQMYSFADRDGDGVTLRPEGTAGCVRACIENGLIRQPQRVWYQGSMFRHERPQMGRYREFVQIGAETFGYPGPDIDVELIEQVTELWRRLGLSDWLTLELNTIGDTEDRDRYRVALVEYLQRYFADLDVDSQRRLTRNPLRILDSKVARTREIVGGAPQLTDYLSADTKTHFDGVQQLLTDLGTAFVLNTRLVRGLDYYNRTVFEWTTERLGSQGTVCAGGRYDGLVSSLGGPETTAAGYAIGIDRVALLVEQSLQQPISAPQVFVALGGPQHSARAMALASRLRRQVEGIVVRVHQGGGSLKSQLRKANQLGAEVVLILGDDEVAADAVSIKWLRLARDQQQLSESALTVELRALVAPSNH